MLSFAPRADGTFPEEQVKMMKELGAWLKICGEAVYKTRPYEVFGEKPNKKQEKYAAGYVKHNGSSEDIRFTRNKKNTVLYATVLDWPINNKVFVKTFKKMDLKGIKNIKLLGNKKKLKWKLTAEGLEVLLPKKSILKDAYPLRIEFKKEIPSIVKK